MIETRDLSSEITTKIPGEVLFARLWGSHSHNTNLPTSDVDYSIIYVVPTNQILSLYPVTETLEFKLNSGGDCSAHEVGKFCRLLLKGNPGIVESLFAPEKTIFAKTQAWEMLEFSRKSFLSQDTVNQYVGYARGQLQRLQGEARLHTSGGSYNTKWAYHLIRLILDARRIIRGEEPRVWKERHERHLLLVIRGGEYSVDKIVEMAASGLEFLEERKPWKLPEHNNADLLNSWLLSVRRSNYGSI